jgi:3-isopropylmalate dehydratase small subunit
MNFGAINQMTIGELLSIRATQFPNQTYLWDSGKGWSYSDVEYRAAALAAGLRELGLEQGDRIALILPNSADYVITLFGAAKAGLIVVPVNIRRHAVEVLARLSKTRPRAFVSFSNPDEFWGVDHFKMVQELRPELAELEYMIRVGDGGGDVIAWEDLLAYTAPMPAPQINPRDPAAIIHTLGSTGDPRGAMLTHQGLVQNAVSLAEMMECTPADIFLGSVPFSNTFGMTATILASAAVNAQLACMPKYHPSTALDLIERRGVTVHNGVPTMFALEINHESFNPQRVESLRTGIVSGAPCPPELLRQIRTKMGFNLLHAYGLTEASPAVAMTRLEDGPVTQIETVGRPLEGVKIKLIGPDGEILSPGKEGELCVSGYNVMLGYWENPAATAQVLDADGWLHTGDLASIDPNGPVRIIGRVDDVIIRAGFKIFPGTVEMAMRAHPAVKTAAVVGVPDMIYGELICACIVRHTNMLVTAEQLMAHAQAHLADYAIPDRILYFDELPRITNGFIRKEYLRERVRIRGKAWKFGKNIDTDAIIPARHCNTAVPSELAVHCMEDADPQFIYKMSRGDLIIADTNFGCGSSREVAPLTIKAAGISAVIAKSFARIFFRNAINIGLPILESQEAVDGIREGDDVEVEPSIGVIHNLTRNEKYQAQPFPDFLKLIIDKGGLLAYVEERLSKESTGGV